MFNKTSHATKTGRRYVQCNSGLAALSRHRTGGVSCDGAAKPELINSSPRCFCHTRVSVAHIGTILVWSCERRLNCTKITHAVSEQNIYSNYASTFLARTAKCKQGKAPYYRRMLPVCLSVRLPVHPSVTLRYREFVTT